LVNIIITGIYEDASSAKNIFYDLKKTGLFQLLTDCFLKNICILNAGLQV